LAQVYEFPTSRLPAKASMLAIWLACTGGLYARCLPYAIWKKKIVRLFCHHNGTVKKRGERLLARDAARIIAINIEQGDELVAASLTDGNQLSFCFA